jgi:hypothetical protein
MATAHAEHGRITYTKGRSPPWASEADMTSDSARRIDDNDGQAVAHILRRERFDHPFHFRG